MLTEDILKLYLTNPNKQKKHDFYKKSVEITNELEAHSKGKYPADIIGVVRPNETTQQKEYRKNAYTPITKTYFSKAVTTITKIGKAEDWSIKWDYENPSIPDNESLEDYTCDNYPNFDSLLNWFWSLTLREMCDDPNGVIAVFPYPKIDPTNDTEYLRPFTFWFESEDVIDYQEGKLAVLRSNEKSPVSVQIDRNNTTQKNEGLVFYIFDTDSWAKCIQIGNKEDYIFEVDLKAHNIGFLPCFKIGGIIEEFENGEMLYDSFVGDCLPFWNEAIRRYSDLQVQMVLHVHSEKWEIEDTPCKTCTGTGQVTNPYMGGQSAKLTCGTCYGSGNVSTRTPFGVKTIKPASRTGLTESVNIPTPPMGYIDKPIDQTQFIHDQVYANIKNGFAAINMEFLMFEPEINSGIAKSLDRQEVNTFFYMIARHIVKNILEPSYYLISKWRYSFLSEEEILKMQPCIAVPTKFDLLTEDILSNRLTAAKTAGASASLLAQLEAQYAKKEFGEDSIQAKIIEATGNLDPLPNKTDSDKMAIMSSGGTTKQKYILSSNLTAFINRAYAENEEFFELTYAEQINILELYTQEIIDDQLAAKVPQVIKIPMVKDIEEAPININANPARSGTQGSDDSALDNTKDGKSLPVKQV